MNKEMLVNEKRGRYHFLKQLVSIAVSQTPPKKKAKVSADEDKKEKKESKRKKESKPTSKKDKKVVSIKISPGKKAKKGIWKYM